LSNLVAKKIFIGF